MTCINLDSTDEMVKRCPRVSEDGEVLPVEVTDKVTMRRRVCRLDCIHILNPGLRLCKRLGNEQCPLHGIWGEHEGVKEPSIEVDVYQVR